MTKRMLTLLGAILHLKAVLDSENILCKINIFFKKKKKKNQHPWGKKGSLCKIFYLDLSSKPEYRWAALPRMPT